MEVKVRIQDDVVRGLVINDLVYSYKLATKKAKKHLRKTIKHYTNKAEFEALKLD